MVNQNELAKILGSEIVGEVDVGHGQLEAAETLAAVKSAKKAFTYWYSSNKDKHEKRIAFEHWEDLNLADRYACQGLAERMVNDLWDKLEDFDLSAIPKYIRVYRGKDSVTFIEVEIETDVDVSFQGYTSSVDDDEEDE